MPETNHKNGSYSDDCNCYYCGVSRYYQRKEIEVRRLRARIAELEPIIAGCALGYCYSSRHEQVREELSQLRRQLEQALDTGD